MDELSVAPQGTRRARVTDRDEVALRELAAAELAEHRGHSTPVTTTPQEHSVLPAALVALYRDCLKRLRIREKFLKGLQASGDGTRRGLLGRLCNCTAAPPPSRHRRPAR
jgi:hypothetical protein